METRTLSETAVEPSEVPLGRLFRVSPDVYQGMLEHGLLPEGGQVAFVDVCTRSRSMSIGQWSSMAY
jgi:hypothetical protein